MSRSTRFRLDDDEAAFIEAFESCTLPNTAFHHREHVRLAWLYIRLHGTAGALDRITRGIRRFAAANGQAGLYHETVTWAFVFIISERIARGGGDESWSRFQERNRDLMEDGRTVLTSYYSPEILASEVARGVFVMPDRGRQSEGVTCYTAPHVRTT